jgi:hypothetical protein
MLSDAFLGRNIDQVFERQRLMDDRAAFCAKAKTGGAVVPMRSAE